MKNVLYVLALLALVLVPTHSVYAGNGAMDGRVVIGQNFTLKSGEQVDGDLVVIGGEVSLESGARVHGDVVVIGGSLRLDGEVSGNAVVIGGAASIGERASLAGDVVTLGGSLQRAQGARIGGDIISNLPPPVITWPNAAAVPSPPAPLSPSFNSILVCLAGSRPCSCRPLALRLSPCSWLRSYIRSLTVWHTPSSHSPLWRAALDY